jgi:maleylpyruvate isomerase
VTTDPLALVEDVRTTTARLIASAEQLNDAGVAQASRLPGWTRGHVLTHMARNADGGVNLLTWARTGVVTPQYASLEQRAADIEAGAGRPAREQVADLRESTDRLAEALDTMPGQAWTTELTWTNGKVGPAALVVWFRLRETELHHVDLDVGYRPDDWSEAFAVRLAVTTARDFSTRAEAPRLVLRCPEVGHDIEIGEPGGEVVSGPVREVVAWLTGRSDGAALTGPLPAVPPFG